MVQSNQYLGGYEGKEGHTFAVNPQQGCGRLGLPSLGYMFLEEPSCRPFVLSAGCEIVIGGWIWRR
jgi:hypothetical protein